MIQVNPKKCTGCSYGYLVCPVGAINMNSHARPVIMEEKCTLCKNCIYDCPTDALSLKSRNDSGIITWNNPYKVDILIIGAGIGGLLIAAYLAKKKKKVLVLEKLGFLGGRFSSLNYKGYELATGGAHTIPYGRKSKFNYLLHSLDLDKTIIPLKAGAVRYNGKEYRVIQAERF